eukprot:1161634-Pelagomonas_calceolata.AAC.5
MGESFTCTLTPSMESGLCYTAAVQCVAENIHAPTLPSSHAVLHVQPTTMIEVGYAFAFCAGHSRTCSMLVTLNTA